MPMLSLQRFSFVRTHANATMVSASPAAEDVPHENTLFDDRPNGGYGWVVVVAMAVINAMSWGMNNAYGVYIAYFLEHDYLEGGSRLRFAFVGGFSVSIALLCGPLATTSVNHLGLHLTMVIGIAFIAIGQCLTGICTQYGSFLVCQSVVFGTGLGMVMGAASGGSGLGGLVLCNTTRVLLSRVSVEYSFIINGGVAALISLPAVLMLRTRSSHAAIKAEPLKLSWLIHPTFAWVCAWGVVAMMAYYIALYSVASFATDGLGLSMGKGATLQSLIALGMMCGRPMTGLFLDKVGRINGAVSMSFVTAMIAWSLWLPARSFAVMAMFALIQGGSAGMVFSSAAPVTAATVGVAELRSALAVFWLAIVGPVCVASPVAVLLLQHSRQTLGKQGPEAYSNSIALCATLSTVGVIMLYGAKWQIQQSPRLLQKT